MADRDPFSQPQAYGRTREAAGYDAGLRAYMLNIYNYMASALALTGIVAYSIVAFPAVQQLFFVQKGMGLGISGLGILALIALFIIPWVVGLGMNRLSSTTLHALFWVYSALMGIVGATYLFAYTGESIARAFFITAIVFGGTSIYGYTTKRDLTGLGAFVFMGFIGSIVLCIINFFLASSALAWAISVIILIASIGLTAYENQALQRIYYQVSGNRELTAKVSIMGAITLYIAFINMLFTLIQLTGNQRR